MTIAEKSELIIRDIKKETGINPAQIFRNIVKNDYINMHGPEHHVLDGTWGDHMQFTSNAIGELGKINGPRCCKRDAMVAFKNGIEYINAHYGVTLETDDMKCEFSGRNAQCIGKRCPYFA